MREEHFNWAMGRVDSLCTKHKYDENWVCMMFNCVDSDIGVPTIRRVLNNLLTDHHYDLVAFFAEILLKDHRVTYRALGKTFANRCAKAPAESPELLRLRDRAEKGLSCFKARVVVSNPWTKGTHETRLWRLFAATQEAAIEMAKNQGQALIPGGRVVDLRVVNIAEDDDADKADVVRIVLRRRGRSPSDAEVTSFAAANRVIEEWMAPLLPSDGYIETVIEVYWESGSSYKFITSISAAKSLKDMDVPDMIKNQIAFVSGEYKYPDRDEQENARLLKELRGYGAEAHCADIRATCLLRDRF